MQNKTALFLAVKKIQSDEVTVVNKKRGKERKKENFFLKFDCPCSRMKWIQNNFLFVMSFFEKVLVFLTSDRKFFFTSEKILSSLGRKIFFTND